MKRDEAEGGFTILELVVCLGVLALITTFLAAGLALVGRGQVLVARAEAQDSGRAVRMHLRRAVEAAVPMFAAREDGTAAIVFTGSPDRLRLVTRSDRRLEGGGLVVAEFAVAEIGGEPALVTRRRPFPVPAGGEEGEPKLLLPGATELRLRYFGAAEMGGDPDWAPEWLNGNGLPQLVEISVFFGTDRRQDWPPIIVALPAAEGHLR